MKRCISILSIFIIPLLSVAQDVVNLNPPISQNEAECGAGFITLTATSLINDSSLEFEWFETFEDGSSQFLGSLDGSTGRSQFITPFLITDKSYAVRVRVGNSISPYTSVLAEILNEASIIQGPEIQICGEAYLDLETEMDSIENYQWQILVPNPLGESSFEDLSTDSSDSTTLIAQEAGFYRVIITDSTGCQAISSEVEVSSDPVVEFVESVAYCYDPDVAGSDVATLESSYGRAFTTFRWEESVDSINFTEISTDRAIEVSKLTSQAYDTAFYRLTITEQNCANDTTIAVYWRPIPDGTISHIDPLIDQSDFFYCGDDPESSRTLQFLSSALGTKVEWVSLNYSDFLTQSDIKSYSGEDGPETLIQAFPSVEFTLIGEGNEIILTQEDGDRFQVNGGLIFAIVTDTIVEEGCASVTNGIFADTAFPFPLNANDLAYEYTPPMESIPICEGEELTLSSYDVSADAYSWQEYDEATDTFAEIGSDESLTIVANNSYEGGTYYLEVTKNGCAGLSEAFEVAVASPPGVAITYIEDGEVFACDDIPSVLLFGEGSDDVTSYQWFYSVNDVNYTEAPDNSSNHFYVATLNGFYKLIADNGSCSSETEPVEVEIPDPIDPEFVQVSLEGTNQYCEEDEIRITCNYEGDNVSYFWYYSFFQIEDDDVAIELVELGETSSPEITQNTRSFGSDLTKPLVLYFYILVIDGDCIAGSTDIPFVVEIHPSPNVELVFDDATEINEIVVCGNEEINEQVRVNNLSDFSLPGITYLWRKYNPDLNDYDTIPGISSTEYTITESGRYQCIAVDSDGFCFSMSNDLDVLSVPAAVNGDTLFCFGNDITLQASQEDLPDLEVFGYQWYYSSDGDEFLLINGQTNSSLIISQESELYGDGYFYYEVTYDDCMGVSEVFEVNENTNSFNSRLEVSSSQEKGVPFEAVIGFDPTTSEAFYIWAPSEFVSFDDGQRAVFYIPEDYAPDSITIQVQVVSSGGCEVLLEQLIELNELSEMIFPKFVSANADGLNDYFQIEGIDRDLSNKLLILDSWGNTIFNYDDYYNQTQASSKLNQNLKNEGVYYYLFEAGGEIVKGSFYFTNQ